MSNSKDSEFSRVGLLSLSEMAAQYGVSTRDIVWRFIPLGLPYERHRNEYFFDPQQVVPWEIETKEVRLGSDRTIILPGYMSRQNQEKAKAAPGKHAAGRVASKEPEERALADEVADSVPSEEAGVDHLRRQDVLPAVLDIAGCAVLTGLFVGVLAWALPNIVPLLVEAAFAGV